MISIDWQPAEELEIYVEAQQAGRPAELPADLPPEELLLVERLFRMSAVVFPGAQFITRLGNQIHGAVREPAEIIVR